MKSRSHFQFRQFSVSDDRCSMKVGTDAVLLATWAQLDGAQRVLDIGTGSGVIALIAAQRTTVNCRVDGIEIQEEDCDQAVANAAASPWANRISMVRTAVQDFCPPYTYDVILCNPPYFINSLRPPDNGRTTARHTVSLDHPVLVSSVNRLLSPLGSANFIMPPEEGRLLISSMAAAALRATRICTFRTRAGKNIERCLLSFTRSGPAPNGTPTPSGSVADGTSGISGEDPITPVSGELTELLLYSDGDRWSKEYRELTQDFYLPRG